MIPTATMEVVRRDLVRHAMSRQPASERSGSLSSAASNLRRGPPSGSVKPEGPAAPAPPRLDLQPYGLADPPPPRF